MSALLNLESVGKRFGFRNILNNINFSVDTGEFVMLIGNNGEGKSTLLRIISSLMKPSNGEIIFRGTKQKDNLLEWLRIMGSITHENRLYADLNSKDNLRLHGTLYGVEQLNSKIDDILAKIDLSHVAQLPVRNFSSGMTKRLMIGRLMLCQPEILILDEPYTGLDQNSFRWFQEYLREFHQQGGTVLMVTHQLELGLELATRILVLHRQNIKHDISSAGLSVEQCGALLEE
ncbi:MAG: heme ABC exporter ATP-binding protein CcmA [SAR324 cluster bacterium]|nr:heme ABC exporter ATP-binding protein CcmA [SAR324 cluster bacterium]MEC8940521.1 heme ABC exporter ATP-binding protein CcmA [SAR324 cluster bacterium]MEC9296976.1 heme ABC exporter ATP-binding protein CcmA [SAR324 cluster bacterium]